MKIEKTKSGFKVSISARFATVIGFHITVILPYFM
jgi:hypothetical protein